MLKWVGVDDAFGASRGSDKWASHAISLQPFHGKKKFSYLNSLRLFPITSLPIFPGGYL